MLITQLPNPTYWVLFSLKLPHHTFAIGCTMSATYPPVKVLLTDSLNQGFICPVEQVQLIYSFSFILLHHLLFLPEYKICYIKNITKYHFPICLLFFASHFSFNLPLKDLPEPGVLDPLDLVNGAVGHGVFEQGLNHVIFHWFGERQELE